MPENEAPARMTNPNDSEAPEAALKDGPLRLPIKTLQSEAGKSRGFFGTLASGQVRPGDRIRVQPAGKESRVARILSEGQALELAQAGQRVTLTLTDEIDLSPGDVISAADAPAEVADQFECDILWLSDDPMLPGRAYRMRIGEATVVATITTLKHRIDADTREPLAATTLSTNEVGVCNITTDRPVPFEPYARNRILGGFALLDRQSGQSMGTGMLHFALRRSHNIHRQHIDLDRAARAAQKGQQPVVLWFTGLSGSGKSTIANAVEQRLYARGRHSYLLDGDNVRHGLNRDLGFTDADRVENIRRIAEVAALMTDAGLIVLSSFISPFRADRDQARQLVGRDRFVEVFVDTPLAVAESRDVKGLYRKARSGELKNFTGIDSPYEAPVEPELRVSTEQASVEECAERVVGYLEELGYLGGA